MKSNRWQTLGVVLFTACVVALHINLTWQDGDEDRYLSLARALASGHGATAMYLPEPRPDWITPPGYPWVLAAMMLVIGPDRIVPLMTLSAVFYVAFAAVLVGVFRRELANARDLVLPAICMALFPVFVLSFVWRLFTETWSLLVFFAVFSLCLGAAERNSRSLGLALAGGLFAGLGFLIRPPGIMLLPAGFLHFAVRRRWSEAVAFSVAMLAVAAPMAWQNWELIGTPLPQLLVYKGSGEGIDPIRAAVMTATNIAWSLPHYLFTELPRRMFFALFNYHCLLCKLHLGALVVPLSVLVAALVLTGFLARARRATVMEFFWIFYWLMFCSFNSTDFAGRGLFNYQERYLIPVIPLAALYFAVGLLTLSRGLPSRWPLLRKWTPRVVVGTGALYVLLAAIGAGVVRSRNELRVWNLHPWDPSRYETMGVEDEQPWAQYVRAGFWIRDNLPTNAIVISRKPQHTFLFSGRRGCRYDGVDVEGSNVWDIVERQTRFGPVVILQDAFPQASAYGLDRICMLDPLIKARHNNLALVYESPPPVTRLWLVVTNETIHK